MATESDSKADPINLPKTMNDANKDDIAQSLIIQAYALSIIQQPPLDLTGDPSLQPYQDDMNDGLAVAKLHVTEYNYVILPQILCNMSNIGNYYALHNTIATTLPEDSTEEQWVKSLNELMIQGRKYQEDSKRTVASLKTFHENLITDVNTFSTIVKDLNNAVEGDNGIIAQIDNQLDGIQGQISHAIAGAIISGLAIIGAGFMICVGSIADFITAGTTIPLIVGGTGILIGGVAGETSAAINLANLNSEKNKLLTKESKLKEEVKLAIGIQSGCTSLRNQARLAVTASQSMEVAWSSLTTNLGSMISDLTNGIMSTDQIRKIFLTNANNDVKTVLTDIDTIKAQMAGVTNIVAKKGQTVSDLILETAAKGQ